MTAATITRPRTRTTTSSGSYVRAGLAATVAASVATTAVAAAGHAAGISLNIQGEPIPVAAFAQLTAVFALVGLALAAVLNRRARTPRRTFVRTTAALTALSLVPDLMVPGASPATRILLMTTHLVAAAIVIPAIARRLSS